MVTQWIIKSKHVSDVFDIKVLTLKTYKDKYKELQPEKYADTVAKVIQKGSTPAGMHRSICVKEILEFLQITPGQTGLDATLGYGGHTLEMLKCLNSKGHLYATDVDAIELPRTQERLESLGYGSEILTIKQMNFSDIDQIAYGIRTIEFCIGRFRCLFNANRQS